MDVNKSVLVELKALHNPPEMVKKLMVATLLLLGYAKEQAREWRAARQFMGQMEALKVLQEHDASKVTPEQAALAKEAIAGVKYEEIRKVSYAASCLHKWVEKALQKSG